MKKLAFLLLAALSVAGCQSKKSETLTAAPFADTATVYMTQEISSEALLRVFEALGVEPQGRVAVKVSTGEPGGHNFLNPQMVKPLVDKVQGTIVECNVAYQSKRFNTETHKQVLVDHGWAAIAPCDILDGESEIKIPVRDTAHIKYDLVGAHIQNYDFLVNLAHFKGHAAGGFGGVLKNQSIGFASRDGKVYIHTAGMLDKPEGVFWTKAEQDDFLESMAAAADGVHQYVLLGIFSSVLLALRRAAIVEIPLRAEVVLVPAEGCGAIAVTENEVTHVAGDGFYASPYVLFLGFLPISFRAYVGRAAEGGMLSLAVRSVGDGIVIRTHFQLQLGSVKASPLEQYYVSGDDIQLQIVLFGTCGGKSVVFVPSLYGIDVVGWHRCGPSFL